MKNTLLNTPDNSIPSRIRRYAQSASDPRKRSHRGHSARKKRPPKSALDKFMSKHGLTPSMEQLVLIGFPALVLVFMAIFIWLTSLESDLDRAMETFYGAFKIVPRNSAVSPGISPPAEIPSTWC